MINVRSLGVIGVAGILIAWLSVSAYADSSIGVPQLQQNWARIKYQVSGDRQEKEMKQLVADADQATVNNPKDPNILIWNGIIRATYAGIQGGLGALSSANQAKNLFEQAIATDPSALKGGAYTSLGSLYAKVPGWPISFGDDEIAEEMLLVGLKFNPDGLDANYFYGDYLLDQGNYAKALFVLKKSLSAPPRMGRAVSDQGRKKEIFKAIHYAKRELGLE